MTQRYDYRIGDRFRTKFNDNQIERRYVLMEIEYQENRYHLRDVATNQEILEPRENIEIFYIKENI